MTLDVNSNTQILYVVISIPGLNIFILSNIVHKK